ncbi:DNA polymerase III subunit alpha [Sporolactobacillus kofuensis]|uniref:DNA-directed DNA polymerase n=1 Tax=Sporolactobacillus kofuensis TaxID=269672 RepID=A0ABW1WAA5_9BACL|nr:DNA polymerase III subunit alpha [Sporolactobacillus kofuensis]MCO7175939.1 DNA polymerase III subunit alpha [Sporolactobacillus kofuensis]
MPYVHLHVHSEYSLLDSTCRINDLVDRAKRTGQTALALTDRDVMYGVIPFYNACKQAGIHPIIGMELSVEDIDQPAQNVKNKALQNHPILTLLAQNNEGYKNLIKLSSLVQMEESGCISYSQLERYASGLCALSGGPEGPIDRKLMIHKDQYAEKLAIRLRSILGNRFFLEIQRTGRSLDDSLEHQLLSLSRKLSIPEVAACTIHYLDPEEATAHACLRCIRDGNKIGEQPQSHQDWSFKSTREMEERFSTLPEALKRTAKIAEACQVTFSVDKVKLPVFPHSANETSEQLLRRICERGIEKRYVTITDSMRARLNHELSIINKMGFNDYFLIVADLVAHARKCGFLPGPGRGSAAGSLVAYVLKITEVDPIKYNLLFERFLNPERVTMPDIDLDFPDVDRDKMIDYVFEKYGREHVAQIITFGTLAAKAAIRDIGRVLGVDPRLVDRMARLVPGLPKVTLKKAYEGSEKLRSIVNSSKEAKTLFSLAHKVEGLPRHSSIHAAGVVLSEETLTESVPVQKGHDGIPVTQYSMTILESLGHLKIDFLGLRNLTFMQEIMRRTTTSVKTPVALESIPLDDSETFQLLSRGDTMGIFQLESDGMRQVLRKLKPTEFEDIVAVIALYRPGPVQFIDRYVLRKHGEEKIVYPHPDLEPILKPTYGVLVYQEQIMQIAVQMAGYSLGHADILRRAVSKKKLDLLEDQKKSFIAGCMTNHYSLETANQIFELIVRFANYGFNRSHAVAYSFITYRLSYLKAHDPQAFMAAHFSGIIGNFEKFKASLIELNNNGIKLLPPSINESMGTFEPSGNAIRFGLSGIKNVGNGAVDELIRERQQQGIFKDLYDFCRRVSSKKVNRKAIESMIFAGAFDGFDVDRAVLLATLDRAIQFGEEEQSKNNGQTSLLIPGREDRDYTDVPPLSADEKMHYEREVLGFYLSEHPLSDYRDRLPDTFSTVGEIGNHPIGKPVTVAVMVEQLKRIKTKSGQFMAFFVAGDETGMIDAVCFPAQFGSLHEIIRDGQMLVIQAKRSEGRQDDKAQLTVLSAIDLDKYLSERQTVLFLKIDRAHYQPQLLEEVKSLIGKESGTHRVVMYYENQKKTIALAPNYAVSLHQPFIEEIRRILGEKNVMIKYSEIFA